MEWFHYVRQTDILIVIISYYWKAFSILLLLDYWVFSSSTSHHCINDEAEQNGFKILRAERFMIRISRIRMIQGIRSNILSGISNETTDDYPNLISFRCFSVWIRSNAIAYLLCFLILNAHSSQFHWINASIRIIVSFIVARHEIRLPFYIICLLLTSRWAKQNQCLVS